MRIRRSKFQSTKSMKQVSDKQAKRNRELQKIKQALIEKYGVNCMICRINNATDLMHLLPKSIYPEYYTSPWNFVLGCRSCHDLFDSSAAFRRKTGFYDHIKNHDPQAAWKYFQMNNAGSDIEIKKAIQ